MCLMLKVILKVILTNNIKSQKQFSYKTSDFSVSLAMHSSPQPLYPTIIQPSLIGFNRCTLYYFGKKITITLRIVYKFRLLFFKRIWVN